MGFMSKYQKFMFWKDWKKWKKYIQFLICVAIILSIACAVKEYYVSQKSTSAASSQNDDYSFYHKAVDNSDKYWNMILINNWNCLPDNFNVSLHKTENIFKKSYWLFCNLWYDIYVIFCREDERNQLIWLNILL